MNHPYSIWHGRQVKRLVTSGFVHLDWGHLIFNMFSLYFFGDLIEQVFKFRFEGLGGYAYLAFYLVGIILSDLPTLWKYRNNNNYYSLGASGAVSAVVIAAAIIRPDYDVCFYVVFCIPAWLFALGYIGYSAYATYLGRNNDGVNHSAHLYGALYGALAAYLLIPEAISGFFQTVRVALP